MEAPLLTNQMIIVFSLLGLAVFLFVFDLLRVDLVGLLMMVLLPLTGVGIEQNRGNEQCCFQNYKSSRG